MTRKELVVSALENGTVLDHIPAENVYKALDILNLKGVESQITIGINLASRIYGKKGIIKVADKFFSDEEISRLSVVAPNVVLSVIRDYDVVEKKEVITPDELHGIVRCSNPKCITNNEPMSTFFHVVDKQAGTLKCHYCEKEQNKSKVKLV
jgi:aspartate carbamoyltransferase regulatory subunit